jgi:hypothetical protein
MRLADRREVAVWVVDIGTVAPHVLLAPLCETEERPLRIAAVETLDEDALVDQLPEDLAEAPVFDASQRWLAPIALLLYGKTAMSEDSSDVVLKVDVLLWLLTAQRLEHRAP